MDKERENQFKEHIKSIAREEIERSFTDNLMETLNSAFIFKYVKTLENQNKKQQEIIDKLEILIENLKLGVTLNQEQEDLLDKILFNKSEASE